jgi:hypothetical protein
MAEVWKQLGNDVQLSRAEGESMMDTLLKYTRDPYPTIQEAVVSCVLSLHSKGFPLKHNTYKAAISLLGDKFESVGLSAAKVMETWSQLYSQGHSGGT